MRSRNFSPEHVLVGGLHERTGTPRRCSPSCDADPDGGGLPRYVERELATYLRCGILAHGFTRVRCQTCHDEIVVAFSCKRRAICPSCTARRMADTAAHLVDPVLPRAEIGHVTLPRDFGGIGMNRLTRA